MTNAKELRSKTNEELVTLVADLDEKIFKLRNELKIARKLEKPHILSEMRKERARVLTILTEKNDR